MMENIKLSYRDKKTNFQADYNTSEEQGILIVKVKNGLEVNHSYTVTQGNKKLGDYLCAEKKDGVARLKKLKTLVNRFENKLLLEHENTTVKYQDEDLLPELEYNESEEIPYSDDSDLSGCVSILGPLQVCYAADLSALNFTVTVKAASISLAHSELNTENSAIDFEGSFLLGQGKYQLVITLDLPGKRLKVKGTVSIKQLDGSKKSKSVDFVLFTW